jgi:regulator of sigma E protease
LLGTTIISLVILLGVLIFVHEIGHFLAAKWAGVKVLKFSLGFGPKIFGKKWGETEYLISIFPLGGYVKLLGQSEDEEMSEEDEKGSFSAKSVWKRIMIVFAGPLANFLMAVVIFAGIYMYGVPAMTAQIGGVQPDSPAFFGGITKGDIIAKIDDRSIRRWDELAESVAESKGRPLRIEFNRGSLNYVVSVSPTLQKAKNIFGEEVNAYKIGVMPTGYTITERLNPFSAILQGTKQTWAITHMTLLSIYKMMEGVISPKNLGGPILIAQIAGKEAREGVIPFLLFMALLSVNLGVLNLLPIPVLDGGHILFFLIEVAKGSPVKPKWREFAQTVGFAVIIILMIFVFYFDLTRV